MSCNQNYKYIKIRRGLWTDFRAENPVLKAGEPSYAYNDTNKLYLIKIGDGVTAWRDLPCLPMNCSITTTPAPDGPCFKYDFYHNNGNTYDLGYYDLKLQENNNPTIDSGNFLMGNSSWSFSGISPGPKDAPHVSVNYDKIAKNGLDFQYHKIDLRFMYDSPSGLKNTVYGDTIPLFTMGDYFSTDNASEVELSFNILRTSPVREDGSMSGTIMLYQEPNNVAIGVSGVDIAPSSWYDVMIQREFADYTVRINDQLVMSGDPTFSNLYLGQNLDKNNFLIGNAYPSGGCTYIPSNNNNNNNDGETFSCDFSVLANDSLPPSGHDAPNFDGSNSVVPGVRLSRSGDKAFVYGQMDVNGAAIGKEHVITAYEKTWQNNQYSWSEIGNFDLVNALPGNIVFGFSDDYWDVSGDGSILALKVSVSSVDSIIVYEFDGSNWTQKGSTIPLSVSVDNDINGVKVSKNGSEILIMNRTYGTNQGMGEVYVWDGSSWTQRGNSLEMLGSNEAKVGHASEINEDGTVVALGSSVSSATQEVKVWEWDGSSWNSKGNRILPETGHVNERASRNLALSSDGNTIACGSDVTTSSNGDQNVGSIRIYQWNSSISDWDLAQTIFGEVVGAAYGGRLVMSSETKYIATILVNAGLPSGSSAIIVFEKIGNGTWQKICPTNNLPGGWIGGGSTVITPYGFDMSDDANSFYFHDNNLSQASTRMVYVKTIEIPENNNDNNNNDPIPCPDTTLWIDEFRASKEHCDDSEETTTTVDPCSTNQDCPVFVQFFEVEIEPNHIGQNTDNLYATYRTTSEFPISDLLDNFSIDSVDSLIVGWNTKMTVYETTNGIKGAESFSITGPVVLGGRPRVNDSTNLYGTFIGNDVDGVPYQTKFPIESREDIATFDHPIGGQPAPLPQEYLQGWMPQHHIVVIESLKQTETDGCGPESNLEVVFNSWS